MAAATMTAADAGEQLASDLRAILDSGYAETLDELREVADELTALLRRTRGRIGRLTRQAKPAEAAPEKEEPKSAAPAPAPERPTASPAPAPRAVPAETRPEARLEPVPVSLVKDQASRTVAATSRPVLSLPVPPPSTTSRPSPRRICTVRYLFTALVVVLVLLRDKVTSTIRSTDHTEQREGVPEGAGYLFHDLEDERPPVSEWLRLRRRLGTWLLSGLVMVAVVVALDHLPLVWDLRFK